MKADDAVAQANKWDYISGIMQAFRNNVKDKVALWPQQSWGEPYLKAYSVFV